MKKTRKDKSHKFVETVQVPFAQSTLITAAMLTRKSRFNNQTELRLKVMFLSDC